MPPCNEEAVVQVCCSKLDREAGVSDSDLLLGRGFPECAPVGLQEVGATARGVEDGIEGLSSEDSPEPANRNGERFCCRAGSSLPTMRSGKAVWRRNGFR